MKNYYAVLCVAVLLFSCVPASVTAMDRPVQLALFTPVQIFSEDDGVTVFRFNLICGRNASVTGLDLVNHVTTGMSKGLQYGLVGFVDADFTEC